MIKALLLHSLCIFVVCIFVVAFKAQRLHYHIFFPSTRSLSVASITKAPQLCMLNGGKTISVEKISRQGSGRDLCLKESNLGRTREKVSSPLQSASSKGLEELNVDKINRSFIPYHITSPHDIFCNRELNMEQIMAVGFDMDYTLAQYKVEFNELAYDGAKDKLVKDLGYPEQVGQFVYKEDISRRGCMIDKRRGNILKLDQHRYVRAVEHGLTALSQTERKSIYRESYQETEKFSSHEFSNIDTPFSLVDACLFAQLVDLKDRQGMKGAEVGGELARKTYGQIWTDMRRCIDRCHKDGAIKHTVAQTPEKYIILDPNGEVKEEYCEDVC